MRPAVLLLSAFIVLLLRDQTLACAVCFGDAESPMAKGAVAGVMVLGGIVGFVLICVTCIGVSWLQRSRRMGPHCENLEGAK